MLATIRSLVALLSSATFLLSANGLLTTLLALRAEHEGFPTWVIGLMLSTYSLGFFAGCLYLPRLIRAVGHIRVYTALAALSAAATLLYVLLIAPAMWLVLRVIGGFCFAGLAMVNESWLNDRANNANRGRILSMYRVVDLSSNTAGQLLLLTASPNGYELFALIGIFLAIAIVPVALTRSSAPAPVALVKLDLPRLFAVSPLAFVTSLVVGIANGAFWALAPVFGHAKGLDAHGVAWLMTVMIVSGAMAQYPSGFISDRIDRRIVLIGTTMIASLASLALAHAPAGPTVWLYVSAGLYGLGAMPMYGLAVAHANDSAARGEFVRVSSGLLLSYAAGATLGPIIAGVVMMKAGPPGLFIHTALFQAALVLYALHRVTRRKPIAAEKKSEVVSMPGVTPEVFDLAPQDGKTERESEAAPSPGT